MLDSTFLFAAPQQINSAAPQAPQILQQALAALNGNTANKDVTLTGSVQYIAGSDDETGTATLKALATAASRVDLSLSSGSRSEVRNLLLNPPAGI
jgi:hypothetical protein